MMATIQSSPNILGIWTCWEPNGLDGQDRKYANAPNHDETGRFIPYIYRTGDSYTLEALVDYETSDYYYEARDSKKSYMTNPFEYNLNGEMVALYTIAIPIVRDNKTLGVVGVDISLAKANDIINEATILDDG